MIGRWSRPSDPYQVDDVAGEGRWAAHPVLAAGVRALVLGVPLVVSTVAVWLLGRTALLAGHRWLRLLALLVVAVVVAAAVERLTRRLLPLAALLKLTMLFPDRAPSRFKVARQAAADSFDQRAWHGEEATARSVAEAVLALVAALGSHDKKTRGHSERVRVFADMVAAELNLPQADRDRLRWAALLHDLGKLQVPVLVLNKPGKLDDGEFSLIKRHPVIGAELAGPLLPWLGEWGRGILDHHERYDGRGYPNGVAGTEISLAGRIVGVVDSFETMTAARAYKKPMSTKFARKELADCAGTQFDPVVVRAFLGISLPKLMWAMGPLSFAVQAPFLKSIAEAGARGGALTTQTAMTAASAAVLATTGTLVVPPVQVSAPPAAAVVEGRAGGGDTGTSAAPRPSDPVPVPGSPAVAAPSVPVVPASAEVPVDPAEPAVAEPVKTTEPAAPAAEDPGPAGSVTNAPPAAEPAPASPAPASPKPESPAPEPPSPAPAPPSVAPEPASTAGTGSTVEVAPSPVVLVPDPLPAATAEPSPVPSAAAPSVEPTAPASPSASAEPSPTASASTSPSASAEPSASTSPSASTEPSPTASTNPSASAEPSPTASASTSPSASAEPSPTASAESSPSPSPAPTASSAPYIVSGPPPTTTSTDATFVFESGRTYDCKLVSEESGWTPCSGTVTYTGLAVKEQKLQYRLAGPGDNTVREYTWTITAPEPGLAQALAGLRSAAADLVDDVREAVPDVVARALQALLGLLTLLAGLVRRLFG